MTISNKYITPGKLVTTGATVLELHYLCELVDFSKEKTQKILLAISICLEVMLQLNKNSFIICVHSSLQPVIVVVLLKILLMPLVRIQSGYLEA
jgi:hypothetical protein